MDPFNLSSCVFCHNKFSMSDPAVAPTLTKRDSIFAAAKEKNSQKAVNLLAPLKYVCSERFVRQGVVRKFGRSTHFLLTKLR